jgi:fengycin family lipopeptide synthetase B
MDMTSHDESTFAVRNAICSVTGHAPGDLDDAMSLEGDLGIDSIKMVELSHMLIEIVPEAQRVDFASQVPTERLIQAQTVAELQTLFAGWGAAPATSAIPAAMQQHVEAAPAISVPVFDAAPVPTAIAAQIPSAQPTAFVGAPLSHVLPMSGISEQQQTQATSLGAALSGDGCEEMFAAIAKVTGHSPNDLSPEQFLESDLGIDSMKMVELCHQLIEVVPEDRRAAFLTEVPIERLMQSQSVADLIAILAPWQGHAGTTGNGACVASVADENIMRMLPIDASSQSPNPNPSLKSETVGILGAQYPFLVSHWAVSTCSLCTRVRVNGRFDAAIARLAWRDLLARHPALRANFAIPAQARSFNEYRFEVASRMEAPAVIVRDLRHLDLAAQEAAVVAEVERCVNREWDLQAFLLNEVFALRLGDESYEIFFANHHLISDGLGNQQAIRELLVLYAAHADGRQVELPPATSVDDYRRTVERINAWRDPAEERALSDLLRRQGKQSFVWNPNRVPKAAHRAHVRQYRFRLDRARTVALIELTRELRMSMNTLLIGAYLKTVAGMTDQSPIILNVPTSGRVYPNADASGTIGCFAQNLALDFAAPNAGESWTALLSRVDREIEQALANGYDRTQTAQLAQAVRNREMLENGRIPESHAGMIRAGMKSNLFLPYIGNTHLLDNYGPLRVVDYQAATVTNAGTLDTVMELFHGRLEMTTNYDAIHYDETFIVAVADEFLSCLRDLAANAQPDPSRAPIAVDLPASTAARSGLLRAQIRQVAEEVMHRRVSESDLDKDLEADLGLDSIERIRIVTRLIQQVPDTARKALIACRSLNEMAAIISIGDIAKPAPAPIAAAANDDDDPRFIPYRQIIAQCAKTPDAVAVIETSRSLTYAQLHAQSNRLARLLRAQGVGRGSFVGLMMPRGIDLVVAILGILKAGGAYVPLDPDYPAVRLSYMLEHAKIDVLLTQTSVQASLAACISPTQSLRTLVYMDERPVTALSDLRVLGRADWLTASDADLDQIAHADDPMVVLYTSGSTGQPKGVVLAHRGYANRHDWHQDLFHLQAGERVAQKTSICFDISVWELFWTLQVGGTMCPVDTSILRDPWSLAQWMVDTRINLMHFVPSLFGEFLSAVEHQAIAFPALRQLVFSGEALPVEHVKRWFARFGLGAKLANLYGPTEASIDVSAWQISEMPSASMRRVPIGHAMPNVFLTVLDEQMRPLPKGEQGELWIGGVQLAQGYLHDPERTAERFRKNPLPQLPCPILYRTGDLVVQLADGSYEYRGRIDSQVKIRGYRVELGEIETALSAHPGVREAAVLALDHGDGHLRLYAWVSGDRSEARDLRDFLAKRLPAYMLPQRFDWLPSLPKNQNGKLDRNALRAYAADDHAGVAHAPDVDALQEQIAANDMNLPLSPAQHWLLSYFEPPYQWAGFSRFRYLQPLDMALFDRALDLLARRHPALRSVFRRKGGTWYQHFPALKNPPKAEYYDGSHLPPDVREQQLRTIVAERVQAMRIDGEKPLWSVIVVREAADRHDIWVVGHHMISDMLGNGVLFNEMWRLYSECLAGREPDVVESASLASYLETLQKSRERESLTRQIDYWTSRFPADAPMFTVPLDRPGGDNLEASSARERFALGGEDCARLQQARQRYGCTLYALLIAPLYRALAEWAANPHVVLSHRVHGRDLGDGQRYFDAVGNFAVNYPLGVRIAQSETAQGRAGPACDWEALVRAIVDAQASVPLGGASYDLVADRLPEHIYPDCKLTPVRANYLGNRDVPKSDVFAFDAEDWDRRFALPNQSRTSVIEVFFAGGTGSLEVEIDYSRNLHDAVTMRRLGERYIALLREMLVHATQPQAIAIKEPAIAGLIPISPATAVATSTYRPLQGKIAIVTGAGRGIGREIAAKLAEQGAQVALVSRTRASLDEALAEVRAISPGHIAITADVTQEEAVDAMMKEVVERFGGLDILINNAGANRPMLLANSKPSEWREILDINLMSTYLGCRAAVPQMAKRGGGKIVNLGSAASVIGYPMFTAYSASKHAVVGLTKALSEEVKLQNIQVNAVCPAFVDTRMTPQAFRGTAMPTSHVADVVLFLASPMSSGITGEAINIFGKQDMYAFGSDKLNMVKNMIVDFRPGVTT